MKLLVVLFFTTIIVQQVWTEEEEEDENWSYLEQDQWPSTCLTGKMQSPISIDSSKALYDSSISPLLFTNFNAPTAGSLGWGDHPDVGWESTLPEDDPSLPAVSGGGLVGQYHLHHLDFRLSKSETEGSDHLIDGKPAVLEIQLEAHKHEEGHTEEGEPESVAIFSYLYQYGDNDNPALAPILNARSAVTDNSTEVNVSINLAEILPPLNVTQKFYRYNGSLTTPPCQESVIWTVFAAPQTVSRKQMQLFRDLFLWNATAHRNVQDLNGRQILTNIRG